MRLCDAETMRGLDHHAITVTGIPGVVLMENAGRGTAELIRRRYADLLAEGVTFLCGRGNNGGDGFVIARHLHNAGLPVQVFLFAPRDRISGDAGINLSIAIEMGIKVYEIPDVEAWRLREPQALASPVVVDALLGTGLNSDVRGVLREVISDLNRSNCHVVAVDIPSGLNASTGRPNGIAVRAEVTTTYGLAKIGQVLEPAVDYVGELVVVDISLPREQLRLESHHDRLVEADDVASLLPDRPMDGHKGTFGHLAVVAGSVGKVGAAVLACHAALRSGVGLVSLALPRSAAPFLSGLWPEIMIDLLEDEDTGHLVPASLPGLMTLVGQRTAVAIGPGISTEEGVLDVVRVLLTGRALPKVVDADGLNVLVGRPEIFEEVKGELILTPHPGEAGRHLGVNAAEIQRDRITSVRKLSKAYSSTVVLKGARTLVCSTSGRISVNPTGNAGMATGGAGDVLTGLIGGLLAQGLEAEAAAIVGVYLHGLAGDIGVGELGQRALTAGDLIRCLGAAFQRVAVGKA